MASRGERNNNPGNLEASPWTRSQPGYVGSDGRFAIFASMQDGINAQAKLIENYINRGFNTVEKIIQRYGNDPGSADDASVANYKNYVANRLGVNKDSVLTKAYAATVAAVMGEFETGNTKDGTIKDNPSIIDKTIDAVKSAVTPDWVINLLNGRTAARWTSVIIGIILIAIAIAAFTFLSGQNVKDAVVKATF